ncbi:uncharacterized protein LOC116248138 [Nymphaea colorata]|nr:uncharacterized protein LOC116248138 [Nymphaea colorata]
MSPYLNLAAYAALLLLTSFVVILFKIHVRILEGIHTYIHPESVGGGPQGNVRAAIRRPEPERGSDLRGYTNLATDADPRMPTNQKPTINGSNKRKDRGKEKSGFDEANAQIFRLRLSEDHLRTRVYFAECKEAVLYSCLSFSCLVVHHFLPISPKSEGISPAHLLFEGSMVPTLLGVFSVCKLSMLLAKISFERSASKRSEKQASVLCGMLGFVIVLVILSVANPAIFYLKFGRMGDGAGHDVNVDDTENFLEIGFSKILLAVYAGCISGFLYIPACRAARSFWLGTDQLHWDLSVISCGKIARVFLYINLLMSVFTASLWTKPMVVVLANGEQGMLVPVEKSGSLNSLEDGPITGYTDILSIKNQDGNSKDPILIESGSKLRHSKMEKKYDDERWVRQMGMHRTTFDKFRLWCLLVSSVIQLLLLRRNVQMYLNEAVLSWYQRLHTSKVPDLDFSRAKLFLHNHYIYQVLLQFLIPPTLQGFLSWADGIWLR